jgi:Tol biopolymer transport system component
MSRGAQQATQSGIDSQLAIQNQLLQQANQQSAQDRSLAMPEIQDLLASQGFSPAEQSAITQQGMGSTQTAYDSLRQRAANRLAATNNPAGFAELTSQLGRQQAQDLSQQARLNQISFANQKLQQRLAGLQAIGNTYGIDTNLLGKAMGVPAQLLDARARASSGNNNFLGGLFGGIGAGLGSLFG